MMSWKISKKSEIHKVLLITLSNIGDVVLTFPVIDILKKEFPEAKLSVVVGPKAGSLLTGNPYFYKVYIFDKHQTWGRSLLWLNELRKERFDLVVDLRNTAIPAFIAPRYRTSFCDKRIKNLHMKEKHLNRLNAVISCEHDVVEKCALFISAEDGYYVDRIIEKEIEDQSRYVVVAPGAADQSKRWPEDRFASVCDWLITERDVKIVFVGSSDDQDVVGRIKKIMAHTAMDLSGRLNLAQLAALLKTSSGAIVNDSAPMHLASYLDIPVLSLFGPSDPSLYGPWSSRSSFIRKNGNCAKCAKPKKLIEHTCMQSVTVEDVIQAVKTNASNGKIHFMNESRI